MNIYVGNLSYKASEEELRQAFGAYGEVSAATIIKDAATGQSRGFAFVEMPNDPEGQAAITGMNGKDLNGRPLKVNEARPREERPHREGGFSGGGGGGYGGDGQRRGGGQGENRGGPRRSW